jgi:hypothetical protein
MTKALKERMTTSPKDSLMQCAPLFMHERELNGLDMNGLQGGQLVSFLRQQGPRVWNAVRDGAIYEAVRTVAVNVDEIIDTVSEAVENYGSSSATDNPTWDESYYARSQNGGFKRG